MPGGTITILPLAQLGAQLDAFTAAELARLRYVDPARTSEAARTLAFLPGYVERAPYFCAKKAVDHALRILAARPD